MIRGQASKLEYFFYKNRQVDPALRFLNIMSFQPQIILSIFLHIPQNRDYEVKIAFNLASTRSRAIT